MTQQDQAERIWFRLYERLDDIGKQVEACHGDLCSIGALYFGDGKPSYPERRAAEIAAAMERHAKVLRESVERAAQVRAEQEAKVAA